MRVWVRTPDGSHGRLPVTETVGEAPGLLAYSVGLTDFFHSYHLLETEITWASEFLQEKLSWSGSSKSSKRHPWFALEPIVGGVLRGAFHYMQGVRVARFHRPVTQAHVRDKPVEDD